VRISAPAVAAVGSRSPSTSEGSFFATWPSTDYSGVPTKEIDDRWDNLTDGKLSIFNNLIYVLIL